MEPLIAFGVLLMAGTAWGAWGGYRQALKGHARGASVDTVASRYFVALIAVSLLVMLGAGVASGLGLDEIVNYTTAHPFTLFIAIPIAMVPCMVAAWFGHAIAWPRYMAAKGAGATDRDV